MGHMAQTAKQVQDELQKHVKPEKAKFFPRFFRTGKGEYGEGDRFIGVIVPDQRKIAKGFRELPLSEVKKLLHSPIHEHRLTSLFILVDQFQASKKDFDRKKEIYDFYIKNMEGVNNWDLVDSSAHRIIGAYLYDTDEKRDILYKLARSKDLWEKRIAMIATAWFISKNDFDDAIKIADILVDDDHDLIHKAVGWMLREIGKRDQDVEETFLKKHYKTMPRTMLRYAIEKFDKKKKDFYMGRTSKM